MSASPEASGATPEDEDDDYCDCPTCIAQQSTPSGKLAKNKMKKTKKSYIAPRPDADTFASQQDFLDSLSPMNIELLETNSLKCPICWKTYGEAPDPGFDNSEQPVRLKCRHVFGHKCLASTFAIPKDKTVALRPISFSSGTRGLALGHRLHAYATRRGQDLECTATSHNDLVAIFATMMQDAQSTRQGTVFFGDFWWPILLDVGNQASRSGRGLTLMENAVIMDRLPPKLWEPTHQTHSSIKSSALTSKKTDLNQPLTKALPDFYKAYAPPPSNYSMPGATTENHQTILPFPPSLGFLASNMDSQIPQQAMPHSLSAWGTMHGGAPPAVNSVNFTTFATAYYDSHMAGLPEGTTPSMSTWKSFLHAETNLDKLTALSKTAQQKSIAQTVSTAETADLDKAMFEVAHKNMLAEKEEEKRLMSKMCTNVSGTLAEVYASYLKEASRLAPEPQAEQQPKIVHTYVVLHDHEAMETEYRISAPQLFTYDMDYAGGVEDIDGDEDQDPVLNNTTFFVITRNACAKPCCAAAKEKRASERPLPKMLRWRNDSKITDDCPICHKVLFHKKKLANGQLKDFSDW